MSSSYRLTAEKAKEVFDLSDPHFIQLVEEVLRTRNRQKRIAAFEQCRRAGACTDKAAFIAKLAKLRVQLDQEQPSLERPRLHAFWSERLEQLPEGKRQELASKMRPNASGSAVYASSLDLESWFVEQFESRQNGDPLIREFGELFVIGSFGVGRGSGYEPFADLLWTAYDKLEARSELKTRVTNSGLEFQSRTEQVFPCLNLVSGTPKKFDGAIAVLAHLYERKAPDLTGLTGHLRAAGKQALHHDQALSQSLMSALDDIDSAFKSSCGRSWIRLLFHLGIGAPDGYGSIRPPLVPQDGFVCLLHATLGGTLGR